MTQPRRKQLSWEQFPEMTPHAAGIDVGNAEHYVAVPPERDPEPVRRFGCHTAELHALADWLARCGIETVAMESTGIYWVPLFEILESRGFTVCLVNARHAKNLPGRKTDLKDCQWLQKLHSCGLLNKSFRPAADIVTLRRYLRHRESLVAEAGTCVQRMQKALTEMNVQLANVISDLSGLTGMRIIRAVLEGERDGHRLAALRDGRIRASEQEIAASLEGNWRDELLFVLAQNVAAYEFYQQQLTECDQRIQTHLQSLATKVDPTVEPPPARRKGKRAHGNAPAFNLRTELYRLTGTDLTQIDGVDVVTAQAILAEIGTDMSAWPTEKHFASWLDLCPDHRISGGKVLRRRTRQVVNPAATALRLAASTLRKSQSALGAKYRRLLSRLGPAKTITALAHHLARLVYRMLKFGSHYVDTGLAAYEDKVRQQQRKWLDRKAAELDLRLVPLGSS